MILQVQCDAKQAKSYRSRHLSFSSFLCVYTLFIPKILLNVSQVLYVNAHHNNAAAECRIYISGIFIIFKKSCL